MAIITNPARVEVDILDAYLRANIRPIFRASVLMEEMRRRGRISYRKKPIGKTLHWKPQFRRRKIQTGRGTAITIAFPQTPVRKDVELPWRHYVLGESVEYYEVLMSQDPGTAIFDITEEVTKGCLDDFLRDFRSKLYKDGNSGAADELHGLESMFSVDGCVTDSIAGDPNDTYAGKSTALEESGDWAPDSGNGWPTGTGDVEAHWWSPLVVDYQNTKFSATTHNWVSQWQQAIRYLTHYLGILQEQPVDLLLLAPELMREAKDSLEDVQRFVLTDESKTLDPGIKKLQFEDITLATEYGVPSRVGYGLTFEHMELRCLTKQFVEMITDTDITAGGSRLYAFQFFGNMMFESPAFFGKLKAISTLGT